MILSLYIIIFANTLFEWLATIVSALNAASSCIWDEFNTHNASTVHYLLQLICRLIEL